MKATVTVTLKPGVLDPAGKAVREALGHMNESGVGNVRIGKFIEIDLDETDEAKATAALTRMCDSLLANPVIENYQIDIPHKTE